MMYAASSFIHLRYGVSSSLRSFSSLRRRSFSVIGRATVSRCVVAVFLSCFCGAAKMPIQRREDKDRPEIDRRRTFIRLTASYSTDQTGAGLAQSILVRIVWRGQSVNSGLQCAQ